MMGRLVETRGHQLAMQCKETDFYVKNIYTPTETYNNKPHLQIFFISSA